MNTPKLPELPEAALGDANLYDGVIAYYYTAAQMEAYARAAVEASKAEAVEGGCTCPEHGSWIAADDVNRLVRRLDVAINGEAGAAPQTSLCDIVAQVERKLESGGWGEAVAKVCLRGDRYGHDNFMEVHLQKAPGVDFPVGTLLYTHPQPIAAVTMPQERPKSLERIISERGYAEIYAELSQGGNP